MGHGFENFTIDEMRKALRDEFPDYATAENMELTKKPLANLINTLRAESTVDIANIEMDIEEILEEPLQILDGISQNNERKNTIDSTKPIFGGEGWSDHVKSQFLPDEIFNDQPKCDGLKRLVEKLIGPIVKKELTHCKLPNIADNTATIGVRITCEPTNLGFSEQLIEESIADANPMNNMTEPYCYHMSATAETKAEARCYRKLLRLKNVVAVEEGMSSTDMIPTIPSTNKITSVQVEGIDRMAQRLNINVMEFVNAGASGKHYDSVNDIEFDTALKMIEFMNNISNGNSKKPDEVGDYNKEWRK